MLFLLIIAGCVSEKSVVSSKETLPVSHGQIDYSASESGSVTLPNGSSVISAMAVKKVDESTNTYTYTVTLKSQSMVQLVVHVAKNAPAVDLEVLLGSDSIGYLKVNNDYNVIEDGDTNPTTQYKFGSIDIPRGILAVGVNTISLVPQGSTAFEPTLVKLIPREIYSENGALTTTIYTQFAKVNNQVTSESIWTRGYGASRGVQMIPGPTLRFKPGDLVQVNLVNDLNPDRYGELHIFDDIQNVNVGNDEELAGMTLHGEFNVPHNLNNTNLHVHGLHVDPSKDDVTIVIVPEGVDTAGYDAPHTYRPVSDTAQLNPWSVSDQGVKPGSWNYQYRIPVDHLPGTHWFHPHKHGATSAQVENGVAGTIVIEEKKGESVIPYSTSEDSLFEAWNAVHDRVLAIQEITNRGLAPGEGNAQGHIESIENKHNDRITVNGIQDYKINLNNPGTVERWRVVNAGTNHQSYAHIWMGKQVDAKTYMPDTIYMVAVDGITLPKLVPVTYDQPALMAPGNRTDFLVKFKDANATYKLFKNYDTTLTLVDSDGTTLKKVDTTVTTKPNPYGIQYSYQGFKESSTFAGVKPGKLLGIVPLIQTKATLDGDYNLMDVKINTAFNSDTTGWQPYNEVPQPAISSTLVTVNTGNGAVADFPALPTPDHLSKLSPITMSTPPAYVSPIKPDDILQSRPIIFDVSGVSLNVINKSNHDTTNTVNQFTLNGRFFELSDVLGNPYADNYIQTAYTSPYEVLYKTSSQSDSAVIVEHNDSISFTNSGGVPWTTANKSGSDYYFMNPGYYQPITGSGTSASPYNFSQTGEPSWSKLSGINEMAVVNKKATKYDSLLTFPSLPRNTSAEEWYLINNSDVAHPFHVHINPFFIVEVGQISYEGGEWFIRAQTAEGFDQRPAKTASTPAGSIVRVADDKKMLAQGIVGNWWDTITVPPHGYVKVRYWINVPYQDDANKVTVNDPDHVGIWVYHCHILRHEDRGMMMPIVTQPLKD